ncbi:MAG: radical SAM protein [Deltaproteobacteria bacterium]|nr:radical SAM protein [Deltaproteobacteria bacterium]
MKEVDESGRVAILQRGRERCVLCPHLCRTDRAAGEKGFCRLGAEMVIHSALPHHGEEPPLSGSRGAGTIFFSSCNLRCRYCQNHQISHFPAGQTVSVEELTGIMLALAAKGCHNIEPVTPTPHLPGIMAATLAARRQGLRLPLVFNCGGYEREKIIGLLAGMVDIYLPDFKYGIAEAGRLFSGVRDYPRHALASLKEMVRQVGDELSTEEGIAQRGILVRHLVLPGHVDNSLAVLKLIREVSPYVPLSLMSQYTPIPAVARHPQLGRRVSRKEYEQVVNAACDMGFEELYTQEVDDRELVPDFDRDRPFDWDGK